MSLPVSVYRCARCDFSTSSALYWGNYEYDTSKGRCTIKWRLGWCRDCDSLRPIESFGLAAVKKDGEGSTSDIARIKLLSGREKNDERCLDCGGRDTKSIEGMSSTSDDDKFHYLGFTHPCCGGEIYITQPEGFRISPKINSVKVYSALGDFLRVEPIAEVVP